MYPHVVRTTGDALLGWHPLVGLGWRLLGIHVHGGGPPLGALHGLGWDVGADCGRGCGLACLAGSPLLGIGGPP
eukprot:7291485-Alexandrium_andersonii.AAC.1